MLPDYTTWTEEELRREMNLPTSDGERILAEKCEEWTKAGDIDKATDCARANLHLYMDRIARRNAARAEWNRRRDARSTADVLRPLNTW